MLHRLFHEAPVELKRSVYDYLSLQDLAVSALVSRQFAEDKKILLVQMREVINRLHSLPADQVARFLENYRRSSVFLDLQNQSLQQMSDIDVLGYALIQDKGPSQELADRLETALSKQGASLSRDLQQDLAIILASLKLSLLKRWPFPESPVPMRNLVDNIFVDDNESFRFLKRHFHSLLTKRTSHHYLNLIGVNLSGIGSFSEVGNQCMNLSGADLSGADLSYIGMEGANLSGANLSKAKLIAIGLSNTQLAGANLSHTTLSFADLHGSDLSGAVVSATDLGSAYLSKSILKDLHFFPHVGHLEAIASDPDALESMHYPDSKNVSKESVALAIAQDIVLRIEKDYQDNEKKITLIQSMMKQTLFSPNEVTQEIKSTHWLSGYFSFYYFPSPTPVLSISASQQCLRDFEIELKKQLTHKACL